MRRLALLGLLALLSPLVAAQAEADDARYHALIAELRCLVCQNQSIAESNAPLAQDLREQVRLQIADGRSDGEIADFLTERYGDFVLYRPPLKPRTWALWLGPFAVALGAILWAVLRLRRRAPAPDAVDREAVARLLRDSDRTP